jgi:uncharacterized protein (TIGR02246 family)
MKYILSLLLIFAAVASSTAQANPAEKHPLATFFMDGIKAFNAHDLDRFMQQFASDVEMYTPTGWLRGNAAVRERFAGTFKQFPNVRMEIEELKVREVVSGTAVTDFKWRVYPMGRGPAFHGVGSGVYVRKNGKWAEVHEHETVTKVDAGLETR